MRIKIIFILFLILPSCGLVKYSEREFDYTDSWGRKKSRDVNKSTVYRLLANIDYKNFSVLSNELKGLEGFYFRADKIDLINYDSISIFDKRFRAENFILSVKTKVVNTRGIATVTYTNRTLQLELSIVEDQGLVIKDLLLERILTTAREKRDENYYAPWVIQLNRRGVFKSCGSYVLWDYFFSEKESYVCYWTNGSLLRIGLAPENLRYKEKEFKAWYKGKSREKEEYLKMMNKLDYMGLFNFTQGCSCFIEGNEGGLKWVNDNCEILFECESNIEPKEILELFQQNK